MKDLFNGKLEAQLRRNRCRLRLAAKRLSAIGGRKIITRSDGEVIILNPSLTSRVVSRGVSAWEETKPALETTTDQSL